MTWKYHDIQIDGRRGAGWRKLTWKKLREKDCRDWKLTTVYTQERSTWRSGVRSAMRAASHLPGRWPTDVDDAPHLHVNQKSDYDMMMMMMMTDHRPTFGKLIVQLARLKKYRN